MVFCLDISLHAKSAKLQIVLRLVIDHHRLAWLKAPAGSQSAALHSPQSRAQFCSYKYRVLSSAGRFRSQTAGAGRCNCIVL